MPIKYATLETISRFDFGVSPPDREIVLELGKFSEKFCKEASLSLSSKLPILKSLIIFNITLL